MWALAKSQPSEQTQIAMGGFRCEFLSRYVVREVRFEETHEDVVARDPITKNVTAGQHPVILIRASLLSKHSAEDVATKILTFMVPLVVSRFEMTITECPRQLTC